MPLFQLFFIILVIGLVVWLINSFTPIDPRFKQLIVIVALIAIVYLIISLFAPMPGIRIGR